MKKLHSAVALFTLLLCWIGSMDVHAQTTPSTNTRVILRPKKAANPQSKTTNSIAATPPVATPTPEPAPPTTPWKLIYFVDYSGPRLTNINLNQTQGPSDAAPSYSEFDHWFKIGYGVSPKVTLGTQIRFVTPLDPSQNLVWKDIRFYVSWSHMIETSSIDMQGGLDVELPTSDKSKANGKIVGFRIKNNWVLKTELRNWFFSAMTMVIPQFYSNPVGVATTGTADISFAIFPWVTLDLVPDWQLLFEGSFDGSHNYNAAYFDLNQGDPDYVDFGPLWSMNSHMQLNPALRFYTGNLSFRAATLYLSFTASL